MNQSRGHMPVYLDYNATTPCDPRVLESMLPWFNIQFGNAASRQHAFGWEAEGAVETAREEVAALIGSEPGEIIFTSGATESVNLALKGLAEAYSSKGNHLITCSTEHKAVLDSCDWLEKKGASVTRLPVSRKGHIDLDELEKSIRPETIAIALMMANNETGLIHPVEKISSLARRNQVLFFSDATQAVGKIPGGVNDWGVDLMAFSAHKIYGPKGVGVLFARRKNPRVSLIPQMHGGGHEKGRRSGTLNVPGIVGMGKACALAALEREGDAKRLGLLRDRLERGLLEMGGVGVNGDPDSRLAHVSNLAFEKVEGKTLLTDLAPKLAVASGSACTSASPEPSHVLQAMGLDKRLAAASIRFSLGKYTRSEDIETALDNLRLVLSSQRNFYRRGGKSAAK